MPGNDLSCSALAVGDFKSLDTDGDSKISEEEFRAYDRMRLSMGNPLTPAGAKAHTTRGPSTRYNGNGG